MSAPADPTVDPASPASPVTPASVTPASPGGEPDDASTTGTATGSAAAPRRQDRQGGARTSALVGAAAAGVVALGSWIPALWSDEVATLSAASRSVADLGRLVGDIDAVHATYYALVHLWLQVAGTSPVALRAPSALAVGLAVAGVHVLARRLVGPRAALVAAAATVLLPRVTWAGVEARPFALALAAAVWLTVLLHSAVGGAPAGATAAPGPAAAGRRRRTLLLGAYAALLAVGTAVNLYVVLVAAAHGVTLLARRATRGAVLPFVVAAAAGVALVSPLVLVALGQGGQLGTPDGGLGRLLRDVVVSQWFLGETPTATTAEGSLAGAFTPAGLWKPASLLLAAAAWLLVAWFVVGAVRRLRAAGSDVGAADAVGRADGSRDAAVLAWALPWLLVPSVVVVAGALVSPSLHNARYLTFCVPALALLLAAALDRLARAPRAGTRGAVAAGVALAVLAAPVLVSQRTETAKSGSDWLAVVRQLEGRTSPGEGVYFGPRDPFVDGVVRRSLRTVSLGYPEPFAGLVDVTLLEPPADGGTLFGTSVPLAERTEELAALDALWVLRRQDREAEAADEDRLLEAAGFSVVDVWDGPQTQVLRLERTP